MKFKALTGILLLISLSGLTVIYSCESVRKGRLKALEAKLTMLEDSLRLHNHTGRDIDTLTNDTDGDGVADAIDRQPDAFDNAAYDSLQREVNLLRRQLMLGRQVRVQTPGQVLHDTVVQVINPRDLTIAFYCPKILRETETEMVTASIGLKENKQLTQVVVSKINEIRQQRAEDPITETDVFHGTVRLSDYLKVSLIDPMQDRIDIETPPGQSEWKQMDTARNNILRWEWLITPKKDTGGKGGAMLCLAVQGKNNSTDIFTQNFPVSIALPETFQQAVIRQLLDIKWLVAIIGSTVSFFVGLRRGKEKKTA